MRRSDREIKNFAEIVKVLDGCEVIRVGISGEEYPYVVPLSFGYAVENDKIVIYFHGAMEGLKHELLAKNPNVCVEADRFLGYRDTGHSVTADYESIIGFGKAAAVEGEEAVQGLALLLRHCGFSESLAEGCVARNITKVYRITLQSVSGKRRTAKKEFT